MIFRAGAAEVARRGVALKARSLRKTIKSGRG